MLQHGLPTIYLTSNIKTQNDSNRQIKAFLCAHEWTLRSGKSSNKSKKTFFEENWYKYQRFRRFFQKAMEALSRITETKNLKNQR